MGIYCIECQKPADRVEHGTPPVFSDHHYIDIYRFCAENGHMFLSSVVGCVRCGDWSQPYRAHSLVPAAARVFPQPQEGK